MSKPEKPLTLSDRAAWFLADALDDVAKAPPFVHDRRTRRAAVTIRPCLRCRDVPAGRPIPFDAWRLLALTHRWCRGRRGPRRRVLLAVYKPAIDLPGTGRISLGCERIVDLTVRAAAGVPAPEIGAADARAAVLLHQAVVDAAAHDLVEAFDLPEALFLYRPDRPPARESTIGDPPWQAADFPIHGMLAYPARMLARPAHRRWEAHPVDGSACPFAEGDRPEGAVRAGWVVRDGCPTPLAQAPERVVARLSGPGGRLVRNPAFAVLKRHGLIEAGLGHRAWLDAVARPSPAGRVPGDVDDPASPSGRFRRGLYDYALADLDGRGRSAHLDGLLGDLREACDAVGVPVPDDLGHAHDFLLGLLDSPWRPALDPASPPIHVLGAEGPEGGSGWRFTNGFVAIDLGDLGVEADRHRPASPDSIRHALRRPSGRGTGRRSGAAFSIA